MVSTKTTKAKTTTKAVRPAKKASAPAVDKNTNEKYEEIKKGDMHITALQKMTIKSLQDTARREKIQEYSGLKKQELIFKILKERVNQNGLMYGEGVVEVLPEGFGFLRSPDYNYLPCPDDIYISPSQIRRFGIRTGNTFQGKYVLLKRMKDILHSSE